MGLPGYRDLVNSTAADRRASRSWRARLVSEWWRSTVVLVVSLGLVLVAVGVADAAEVELPDWGGGALFLAFYCLSYAALTFAVFSGLPPAEMAGALRGRVVTGWRRAWNDEGPSLAVLLSAASLLVVISLVTDGSLRGSGVATTVTVVMVVAAWWTTVLAYAVHYAKHDVTYGGLAPDDSPGAAPPDDGKLDFRDYVQLSLSVATLLGPTGLRLTSRRMRRVVTFHALVAFVFNTVILALLVAALTGGG